MSRHKTPKYACPTCGCSRLIISVESTYYFDGDEYEIESRANPGSYLEQDVSDRTHCVCTNDKCEHTGLLSAFKVAEVESELDLLLAGKQSVILPKVIELALNKCTSLSLDVEPDRTLALERIMDTLYTELSAYYERLRAEHSVALMDDDTSDIDTGVLLGALNLVGAWAEIDDDQ